MAKVFSDKDFGRLVQRTLRAGVFLSLVLFFLGFILRISGLEPAGQLFRAGVLALVLTPAARVAMLVYGYCRTKEYRFALASLTVLALLFISVLL